MTRTPDLSIPARLAAAAMTTHDPIEKEFLLALANATLQWAWVSPVTPIGELGSLPTSRLPSSVAR